jgi:hypothetical protein
MCLEQSPDLQQGAVHGGAAAAEQHGEGFRGQGDPQVQHSGQDLFGEGETGWTAAPGITVRSQSLSEVVQSLLGHPGKGGVGQQGRFPLRRRRL